MYTIHLSCLCKIDLTPLGPLFVAANACCGHQHHMTIDRVKGTMIESIQCTDLFDDFDEGPCESDTFH